MPNENPAGNVVRPGSRRQQGSLRSARLTGASVVAGVPWSLLGELVFLGLLGGLPPHHQSGLIAASNGSGHGVATHDQSSIRLRHSQATMSE